MSRHGEEIHIAVGPGGRLILEGTRRAGQCSGHTPCAVDFLMVQAVCLLRFLPWVRPRTAIDFCRQTL